MHATTTHITDAVRGLLMYAEREGIAGTTQPITVEAAFADTYFVEFHGCRENGGDIEIKIRVDSRGWQGGLQREWDGEGMTQWHPFDYLLVAHLLG